MNLNVLYEDNHLIAVFKPAGVLVQGDSTGDATLMDEVKYYLKQKYHKTGKVFLGLLHRLDRPVAGVILFAKTSKGASRLSEQIRNHEVKKIYHALVVGKPKKDRDTLVHYLEKDEKTNKVTALANSPPAPSTVVEGANSLTFTKGRAGEGSRSQRAELSYEVIKTHGNLPAGKAGASLLKIILGTGRSHQIRAQLAAIGCPIVGDVKYGGNTVGAENIQPLREGKHSIALVATSLTFKTATGGEVKTVEISAPKEWANIK